MSTQRHSVEDKSMFDIMKPQLITGAKYSFIYFIALSVSLTDFCL